VRVDGNEGTVTILKPAVAEESQEASA